MTASDGKALATVIESWRHHGAASLTLSMGPGGGGELFARWLLTRVANSEAEPSRAAVSLYRDADRKYEVWDVRDDAGTPLDSPQDGIRRILVVSGTDGDTAGSADADVVDADALDLRTVLHDLLVDAGADQTACALLSERFAPATRLADQVAGAGGTIHGVADADVVAAAHRLPLMRSLHEQVAGTPGLLELGRLLLLLRPQEVELSDEWARLASALSGRRLSTADISRTVTRFSWLFHHGGQPGRPTVQPKHPLGRTLLEGLVPISGSEHFSLYRALRERALETLRSKDSSDRFVAEQLPRQAMESFSFTELFQDPVGVLCSDTMALVREIERDPQLVLHPGAKAVLLTAHRLEGDEQSASNLELSARRVGLGSFAAAIHDSIPDRPWQAVWTRSQPVNANRVVLQGPAPLLSIAVAAESSGVVAGASDGRIWLAEPYGRPRCIWGEGETAGEVRAVGVHRRADGRLVAAGATSDQQVVVVDVATLDVLWHDATVHQAPLSALAIGDTADGPLLATSGVDGVISIVPLTTAAPTQGGKRRARPEIGGEVRSMAFVDLPGGTRLVFCTVDGTVGLVEPMTSELLWTQPVTSSVLNSISVLTDDDRVRAVLGGSDGTVLALEIDENGCSDARPVYSHGASVNSVQLHRRKVGGLVALSASSDRSWALTELDGGATHERVEGHFGPVWSIAWLAMDDRDLVVTAGNDGCCRVWVPSAVTRESLDLERPTRHSGPVTAVDLHAGDDGVLVLTGGADGDLRSWPVHGSASGRPLARHHTPISAVISTATSATSADLVVYSGTARGELYRTTETAGQASRRALLGIAHDGVTDLVVAHLRNAPVLLSGGRDGAVTLWSTSTEEPLASVEVSRYGAVTALCILDQGAEVPLLAAGSQDGWISFRRVEPMDELWRTEMGAPILAAAPLPFHNTGLVVGLANGDVRFVRDVRRSHHEWSDLGRHAADVTGVAALVIGGRLAVVSVGLDRRLRLWDLSTKLVLQDIELDGAALGVATVAFHVAIATTAGATVFTFSEDPLVLASRPR